MSGGYRSADRSGPVPTGHQDRRHFRSRYSRASACRSGSRSRSRCCLATPAPTSCRAGGAGIGLELPCGGPECVVPEVVPVGVGVGIGVDAAIDEEDLVATWQIATVHDLGLRPSVAASRRTGVWLLFKNEPPCSVISPPAKKSLSVQQRPPARSGLASYTVLGTGAPLLRVHNMWAHRRPARPAPTIAIRGSLTSPRDAAPWQERSLRTAPSRARPRRPRSTARAWSGRPRSQHENDRAWTPACASRVPLQPAHGRARSACAGRTCAAPSPARASALLGLIEPPSDPSRQVRPSESPNPNDAHGPVGRIIWRERA